MIPSFAEQVFERQFALDIAAVLIVMQTIGRDQSEMDGPINVASRPKCFPSIATWPRSQTASPSLEDQHRAGLDPDDLRASRHLALKGLDRAVATSSTLPPFNSTRNSSAKT